MSVITAFGKLRQGIAVKSEVILGYNSETLTQILSFVSVFQLSDVTVVLTTSCQIKGEMRLYALSQDKLSHLSG